MSLISSPRAPFACDFLETFTERDLRGAATSSPGTVLLGSAVPYLKKYLELAPDAPDKAFIQAQIGG